MPDEDVKGGSAVLIFIIQMAKRVEAVIVGKEKVNHDCYIYSFEFVHEHIHFSIGQHFKIIKQLKTHDHPEGETLARKYTPINPCSQTNRIDFLVKIYRPHPHFPHGGKYTPFLESQNVGDKLLIEGPFGRFSYHHGGNVTIDGVAINVKRIFFMAGGSGITPIFQTLIQIANMKQDQTELILLYANKTEQDIVLRKQLENHSKRIKIHYILDHPPKDWTSYQGHITHQILQQICPLNDPSTLYVHCGPFPMNKFLRELFGSHYPESHLFKF